MAENLIPTNLGFAEFVSTLLRETFDAVTDSYAEQLSKQEEIKNQLQLDTASFANLYVSENEVSEELQKVFGDEFSKEKPIITEETVEKIKYYFGLEVEKEQIKKGVLSDEFIEKLNQNIRLKLGEQKRNLLQQTFSSGNIPMFLMVDSGEIKAKVAFGVNQIQQTTDEIKKDVKPDKKTVDEEVVVGGSIENPQPRRRVEKLDTTSGKVISPNMKEIPLANLVKRPENLGRVFVNEKKESFVLIDRTEIQNKVKTNPLPNVRLTVQQADSNASTTNLFSEVTIRFKTL